MLKALNRGEQRATGTGDPYSSFPPGCKREGSMERRSPSRHQRSLPVADLARHPTTGRTVGAPHGDQLGEVENGKSKSQPLRVAAELIARVFESLFKDSRIKLSNVAETTSSRISGGMSSGYAPEPSSGLPYRPSSLNFIMLFAPVVPSP